MIRDIQEQIANARKAINETETPVRRHYTKNALTRLNNEIVEVQVKDILNDEGCVGCDN